VEAYSSKRQKKNSPPPDPMRAAVQPAKGTTKKARENGVIKKGMTMVPRKITEKKGNLDKEKQNPPRTCRNTMLDENWKKCMVEANRDPPAAQTEEHPGKKAWHGEGMSKCLR